MHSGGGCRGLAWHLQFMQLQRPGLAASVAPGLQWQGEGLRRLALANPTTFGQMPVKPAEHPQQLCRLSVSSALKAFGLTRRAGYWEVWLPWLCDYYWNHPLFFPQPSYLHISQLYQSLSRVNWSRSFLWGPQRQEKLVAHPILPFLVSSNWRGLSWCWAMPACGMGWCRQNEAACLPFWCGYSQVVVVIFKCCWNFLGVLQSCYLFLNSYLIVDLCWGWKQESPTPSRWYHSQICVIQESKFVVIY